MRTRCISPRTPLASRLQFRLCRPCPEDAERASGSSPAAPFRPTEAKRRGFSLPFPSRSHFPTRRRAPPRPHRSPARPQPCGEPTESRGRAGAWGRIPCSRTTSRCVSTPQTRSDQRRLPQPSRPTGLSAPPALTRSGPAASCRAARPRRSPMARGDWAAGAPAEGGTAAGRPSSARRGPAGGGGAASSRPGPALTAALAQARHCRAVLSPTSNRAAPTRLRRRYGTELLGRWY